MRLLLIRHGETDWNRTNRWQGHTDEPLNDRGREQAARRAARLVEDGFAFDALVSSDLVRAFATAQLIGDRLGLAPIAETAFRERHGGQFEGLDRSQLEERFAAELAAWRAGKLDRPPGGESDAEVHARVVAGIDAVGSLGHDTLLVVTHGGVMRILGERGGGGRVSTSNLGGRWFEWDGSELSALGALEDIDAILAD